MSYSRWHSKDSWYIYWHTEGENVKQTRDNQLLAVWYTGDSKLPILTSKVLRTDREKVWDDIQSRVGRKLKERDTFDECIDDFLEEVEIEYNSHPPKPNVKKGK